MKLIAYTMSISLVALILILSACSGPGVGSSRNLMIIKNSNMFRNEAVKFIDNAKQGKIDKMVNQTSEITISNEGEDKIKRIYKNEISKEFIGKQVVWDDNFAEVYDSRGNMGLAFSGKAIGDNEFLFSVGVFGENGRVVIVTVQRK